MSVMGTGVAAGVAQTVAQAQDVARQQDKRKRDEQRAVDRIHEILDIRLRGLEEEDEAAKDPARIHIDNQVPEHEHAQAADSQSKRRLQAEAQAVQLSQYEQDSAELSAASSVPTPSDSPDSVLKQAYQRPVGPAMREHHLDVQA